MNGPPLIYEKNKMQFLEALTVLTLILTGDNLQPFSAFPVWLASVHWVSRFLISQCALAKGIFD